MLPIILLTQVPDLGTVISMYVEDAAKANSQTEVFVMLFPGNMRSEYLLPSNSTGKNIHLDVVKTLKKHC